MGETGHPAKASEVFNVLPIERFITPFLVFPRQPSFFHLNQITRLGQAPRNCKLIANADALDPSAYRFVVAESPSAQTRVRTFVNKRESEFLAGSVAGDRIVKIDHTHSEPVQKRSARRDLCYPYPLYVSLQISKA